MLKETTLDKPVLHGERVTLRPIVADDAEAMFASLSDEEARRLTGTQQTFTLEQVRAFCARVRDADDRLDYAITLPDDGRYRGEVVLNNIDWDNRVANFRIAIGGADDREKGYGSEAARLLLAHAFDVLDLHRIELEVFDFNPRAQHVYKKLGFVQEGVLRDVLFWEGAYHSVIKMSLLAPEYRARRTEATFRAIETERLVIRRLRADDVEALVAYRKLPEVAWMQSWEGYDVAQGRALVRAVGGLEPFLPGSWFQFAVALRDTDTLVGDLYLALDDAGQQAEIGYTFDPAFQGRGLATEAVSALVHHAFTKQGLHRIHATTDPRNVASIDLLRRVGMRQEAHHRASLWFKGAWADDVVFAVLADEWRQDR